MSKLRIKSMLHNEADILEAEDAELQEVITPAVDNIVEPKLENKVKIVEGNDISILPYTDKTVEALLSVKTGDIYHDISNGIIYICIVSESEDDLHLYLNRITFDEDVDTPIVVVDSIVYNRLTKVWSVSEGYKYALKYNSLDNTLYDPLEGTIYPKAVIGDPVYMTDATISVELLDSSDNFVGTLRFNNLLRSDDISDPLETMTNPLGLKIGEFVNNNNDYCIVTFAYNSSTEKIVVSFSSQPSIISAGNYTIDAVYADESNVLGTIEAY